jgi:lysophospholipase L1-like esterase
LVASLLIPSVGALVLWRSGHPISAEVVSGIVVVHFVGWFGSRLYRSLFVSLGGLMGRGVTAVIGSAVFFGVITPVSLISHLVGVSGAFSTGRRQRRSYWTEVPEHENPHDYRLQFLPDPPRATESSRRYALLRGVLRWTVVLLVLNFAAGYLFQPDVDDGAHRNYSRPAWAYAAEWKSQYADEFARSWVFRYDAFVGWRRRDFRGRFINISNGLRQSHQSNGAESPGAIRIFFLGASTIWGTGARDDYTVPSIVARLAEQRGWAVEVTNFGESAYNSFQEAMLLSKLVATGNRPDLVVFLDGSGDLVTQLEEGPSSLPIHDQLSRFREHIENADGPWRVLAKYSFVHQRWRRLQSEESPPFTAAPEVYAEAIVRLRSQALDLAFDLSRAAGFAVLSFHQPSIFTKKLLPHERLLPVGGRDPQILKTITDAVGAAIRGDSRIVDITDALDGAGEPVMIDAFHANEMGNQMIAERMFRTLAPLIDRAIQSKSATHGAQ